LERGLHPVFGLLANLARHRSRRLAEGLRAQGQRDQAEEAMFPAVEVDGQTIDPLFNINRPDELAAAVAFRKASAV
jgi:molybdopterin-guanine dinucleotide biosynthesis protein A